MPKNFPKILIYFFLIVFLFQLIGLVVLVTIPESSQAAADVTFTPQVGIGDEFKKGVGKAIDDYSIGKYILAIYNYLIGIVGILATVVMMIGGVVWLTAGGNPTRIGEAKAWIGASLTGLLLALCSFLILNTINPELIELKPISPKKVDVVKDAEKNNVQCEWVNIPSGLYYCNDVSGYEGWRNTASSNCTKTKTGNACCCKEKEQSTDTTNKFHKECFKQAALPSGYTYHCQLVSGEGTDACTADLQCNAGNSN